MKWIFSYLFPCGTGWVAFEATRNMGVAVIATMIAFIVMIVTAFRNQ